MGSILIVQADQYVGEQWAAALGEVGHAVTTVSVARDALPTIRDGGIDVIVIDVYDPRIGVLELARSIELLPDGPPIILVSGSPHAPEISARIGAVAFVPQPCESSEIVAAVAQVVGNMRPVRVISDEPTRPTGI